GAEAELGAEDGIGQRRVVDLLEGWQQRLDASLQEAELAVAEEPRSQHGAQGALAEMKAAEPRLPVEVGLRVGPRGFEQVVVGRDGGGQHAASPSQRRSPIGSRLFRHLLECPEYEIRRWRVDAESLQFRCDLAAVVGRMVDQVA